MARLLARCISCYVQLRHEHNELARLGDHSLRDIGLSPHDVAVITKRPIWRRCWQSVLSCSRRRCRVNSQCVAECRLTTNTSFSARNH